MIVGLDSAQPPTPAQASAARAAGVRVWSGYLATRPGVGLYHPWTKLDFEAARICGGTPIAYASGNDDPVACKAHAAAWSVRLCLDVESGIRADGPWVDGWLASSGAGLYGTGGVHTHRRAAFHILAAYLNRDPSTTWPLFLAHPAAPCGWQWQNTHQEFGVGVDRSWLDPWFGGDAMTVEERLTYLEAQVASFNSTVPDLVHQVASFNQTVPQTYNELQALKQKVDALPTTGKPAPFDATITPK